MSYFFQSGFPFDRDFDRDSGDQSFRSQLDDIAKRHPEFAEHLEGFPFRSETSRRARPPRPEEFDHRRFANRPFGSSRFERFGFPFDDDYERFDDQQPQQTQSSQDQHQPQTERSTPPQATQQASEQKKAPERGRNKNIQQSNTVDLGQRQEPVNDRNQRSMSAPPPDNRQQQRFVSSINIPVGGMGDMGAKQSQQNQPQQEKQSTRPMERVIPIHVEGRDEPVMPKHAGPSFTQSQPQPERVFGHRPSQFTQFVGSPRQYSAGPEWHHQGFAQPQQQQKFYQQEQHPQYQQPPAQPPPQPAQPPQQQQQPPPQKSKSQEQVPPPQAPKVSNDPIDIIQLIQKDVSELMNQVEKFEGFPRDKQYLYLDEMLTRNLIKLDNIDPQGQDNIRAARKEAIKCIEKCIAILDAKAAANSALQSQSAAAKTEEPSSEATEEQAVAPESQQMEVETQSDEPKSSEPETVVKEAEPQTSVQENETAAAVKQEDSADAQKMEVTSETPALATAETTKGNETTAALVESKVDDKQTEPIKDETHEETKEKKKEKKAAVKK